MVDSTGRIRVLDPIYIGTRSLQRGAQRQTLQERDLKNLRRLLLSLFEGVPVDLNEFKQATSNPSNCVALRSAFETLLSKNHPFQESPSQHSETPLVGVPSHLSDVAMAVGKFLLLQEPLDGGLEPVLYPEQFESLGMSADEIADGVVELKDAGLVHVAKSLTEPFHNVQTTYRLAQELGRHLLHFDYEDDIRKVVRHALEKNLTGAQIGVATQLSPIRVNRAVEDLRNSGRLGVHGTPLAPFMFDWVEANSRTRQYARQVRLPRFRGHRVYAASAPSRKSASVSFGVL